MGSAAALVSNHFSRNINWFEYDDEADRVLTDAVGKALSLVVGLAQDLTALDLSTPPAPLVQWVRSSRWWDFHASYEARTREMLTPYRGMLAELPSELPTWGLFEDGENPQAELEAWPADWPRGRPPCVTLIKHGMVTETWITFIKELAAEFSRLSNDCQLLPRSVPEAHCLVMRAYLLASDFLYLCRVNEYAWFLHRPPGMPPELKNPAVRSPQS